MKNRFYVYSYSTEKDGVFWIGKGTGYRINRSHKSSPACYNILEARKRQGIGVTKEKLFENIAEKDAFRWETTLIWFYNPKANLTNGGEGASGHKHSRETRRKMSEYNTGKKLSKEHKEKIAKALAGNKNNKGNVRSEETKRKMSEAHRGEKNPMFGKKLSEEHRRKIGEAQIGKITSEETKRKMSIASAGEKCYNSKMTWVKVRELRSRRGENRQDLAKEFMIARSTVDKIMRNESWKEDKPL